MCFFVECFGKCQMNWRASIELVFLIEISLYSHQKTGYEPFKSISFKKYVVGQN